MFIMDQTTFDVVIDNFQKKYFLQKVKTNSKNSTTYGRQHPTKCSEAPRPSQELKFCMSILDVI